MNHCLHCGEVCRVLICDGCRAKLVAEATWDGFSIGCHADDILRSAGLLARSLVLLQLAQLASKIVRSAPSSANPPQTDSGSEPPAGRSRLRVVK